MGDPLAPGKIQLLKQEIHGRICQTPHYRQFCAFSQLRCHEIKYFGGPVHGLGIDGQLPAELVRPFVAQPSRRACRSRTIHPGIAQGRAGQSRRLCRSCWPSRQKRWILANESRELLPKSTSPQQALEIVKQSIADAEVAYAAALAPLTKSQIRELQTNIYPVLVGQNQVGHTLNDRGTGRRLCDLMEMMDRNSLFAAADALVPITDPELLEQLKSLPADGNVKVEGVTGTVVDRIDTPSGAIIIGGKGQNTYQLDKMPDVCAVIDLGGDDTYIEGTVGLDRPVLVVVDLGGKQSISRQQAGHSGRRDPRRLDAPEPRRTRRLSRPRTSPKVRRWPASAF